MRILGLLLLSLFGVHSQLISPTNVTGDSVIIHFDWEDNAEPSYSIWILELWKDGGRMWQRTLNSKPISMQMSNLEGWTNYTLILKNVRDLHFHNIVYTRDVLREVCVSFITVPRILTVKKIKGVYDGVTVLRASIQIFNARKYKWSLEWKDIGNKGFNQKTRFRWVSRYQDQLTVTIPRKHKAVLARVRIKAAIDLHRKEEYYGPTQLVMI